VLESELGLVLGWALELAPVLVLEWSLVGNQGKCCIAYNFE
jgi:hypothetical protein